MTWATLPARRSLGSRDRVSRPAAAIATSGTATSEMPRFIHGTVIRMSGGPGHSRPLVVHGRSITAAAAPNPATAPSAPEAGDDARLGQRQHAAPRRGPDRAERGQVVPGVGGGQAGGDAGRAERHHTGRDREQQRNRRGWTVPIPRIAGVEVIDDLPQLVLLGVGRSLAGCPDDAAATAAP